MPSSKGCVSIAQGLDSLRKVIAKSTAEVEGGSSPCSPRPHRIDFNFPIEVEVGSGKVTTLADLDFAGCPWLREELYGWECSVESTDSHGWGKREGRGFRRCTLGFHDDRREPVLSFSCSWQHHGRVQKFFRGNVPELNQHRGGSDFKLTLFTQVESTGPALPWTLHNLRLRIYTRSGVAFNTLNMLHLIKKVKSLGQPLTVKGEKCDGARCVILSLGSAEKPVPQDVIEVVLGFLYLPLIQLPRLFHRRGRSSAPPLPPPKMSESLNRSRLQTAAFYAAPGTFLTASAQYPLPTTASQLMETNNGRSSKTVDVTVKNETDLTLNCYWVTEGSQELTLVAQYGPASAQRVHNAHVSDWFILRDSSKDNGALTFVENDPAFFFEFAAQCSVPVVTVKDAPILPPPWLARGGEAETRRIKVTIQNTTSIPLTMYWVDEERATDLSFMSHFAPGQAILYNTYISHWFIFRETHKDSKKLKLAQPHDASVVSRFSAQRGVENVSISLEAGKE